MLRFAFPAAVAACAAFLATAASAQTVDNQYKDWTVFKHDDLCYIGTAPKENAKDGKTYFLVTNRKANVDEVSLSLGAPFKADADVMLNIGKSNFKLFSQEDVAWARDGATDAKIVSALKTTGAITVKATLRDGKATTQKFSLSGFSAAYKRMKSLCK